MKERRSPRWIAPIVTWLASTQSAKVTGRVLQVSGRELAITDGWLRGPSVAPLDDPTGMGPAVADLMAKARLKADMRGDDSQGPGRPVRTI